MTDIKDIPLNANQTIPLATANEIVTTIMTDRMTPEGLQEFQTDPHAFLLANADSSVDESIEINFADNDDKTVHLTLPYYEYLENMPQAMSDEEAEVSGGFEWVLIIVSVSGSVAVATATTAGVGAGVGIGVGMGIAIGAAVAAGVASAAALGGLAVAAAHAGMSAESYMEGITTTSVGNGQVWKRA